MAWDGFAKGPNSEDIATGHKGCFPMALTNNLREFSPVSESIPTGATGNLDETHARRTLA